MSERPELEAVDETKILRLQPGDVIVIKSSRRLTAEQAEQVQAQVRGLLGEEHVIMVLPPELDIEVLRRDEAPGSA